MIKLKNNFHFIEIPNLKFNSNVIQISFFANLSEINQAARYLLSKIMENGFGTYSKMKDVTRALDEMYGANLKIDSYISGSISEFNFKISFIDSKLIHDDNLTKKIILFIREAIFQPFFNETIFLIEKDNLINEYNSVLDDKTKFAAKKIEEEYFSNSEMKQSSLGRIEDIQNLSLKDVEDAYKHLLENEFSLIFYFGNENIIDMFELFDKASDTLLGDVAYKQKLHNFKQTTIVDTVEQTTFMQMYNVSNFEINLKSRAKLSLFSAILGGTNNSLLFTNIREKQSLAYSVASWPSVLNGTLTIYAGIEEKNINKVQQTINEEIQIILNEKYDNELLDFTKTILVNSLLKEEDSISMLVSRMIQSQLLKQEYSVNDYIEEIKKITKKDLAEFTANNIFLQNQLILIPRDDRGV
ncbi:MAG: insulinase family protein [Lactobacillaceae bacterium]|jgi:predicted Zn-dependent peptidase|nr:insulinase family protein [Lactobacillaceae bacterium]